MEWVSKAIEWTNANEGFLALVIFLGTLVLGVFTGTFRWIFGKTQLKLSLIEGPNIATELTLPYEENGHNVKRIAMSIYLCISNVGRTPTAFDSVRTMYRSDCLLFKGDRLLERLHVSERHIRRLKRLYKWVSIDVVSASLSDFTQEIGENYSKRFPFLIQVSNPVLDSRSSYLRSGESVAGIVYYESSDYWGGFSPRIGADRKVDLIVKVIDGHGRAHKSRFQVPLVSLTDARRWSPQFGATEEIAKGDFSRKSE